MADEPREPAIEVDALRWERVQLIVEARVPAGITLDPSDLDLVLDAAEWARPFAVEIVGAEPCLPLFGATGR